MLKPDKSKLFVIGSQVFIPQSSKSDGGSNLSQKDLADCVSSMMMKLKNCLIKFIYEYINSISSNLILKFLII